MSATSVPQRFSLSASVHMTVNTTSDAVLFTALRIIHFKGVHNIVVDLK